MKRATLAVAVVFAALGFTSVARAADAPSLTVTSLATPTNFVPELTAKAGVYDLRIANLGGAATDGSEDITVTDTLPAGLVVEDISMVLRTSPQGGTTHDYGPPGEGFCGISKVGAVETVTCTISESIPGADEPATLQPGEERRIVITVKTPGAAQGQKLQNQVVVEGGGAPVASVVSEGEANSQPAAGGVSLFRAPLTEADGQPSDQASSHPYQFTIGFAANTKPGPGGTSKAAFVPAGGDIKDIRVPFPPGLIGNPMATPRCTPQQFSTTRTVFVGNAIFTSNACPDGTAVGMVLVQQIEGEATVLPLPLYNLQPPPGMPALFGTQILNLPFYMSAEVRPDDHYRIVGKLTNLSQGKRLTAATVVLWGNPGDSTHDPLRGTCLSGLAENRRISIGNCEAGPEQHPFLRLPSNCSSPLDLGFSFSNWTNPSEFVSAGSPGPVPSGCNQLAFYDPSLRARPTTDVADSPSGLSVDLHVPQKEHEEPAGRAEPDLRDVTVTFPPGLVLNPASANGLDACTPAQIDLNGPGPASCPDAARVGTVEVDTPLLDHPLPGSVYVATPFDNPFGTLLAVYIAVDDPVSGIVVKLAGKVEPDPATGQLTSTFTENPQTPFEDFKLEFFGGPRGALRTPSVCGPISTVSTLTPWSAPESGPAVTSTDTYSISSSPGGGLCPTSAGDVPFAPAFEAGTVTPVAKAFSPFVIKLQREDGSQEFSSVTVSPPPGLLAKLAGVPYCPDSALAAAAANSGRAEQASPSCPSASQVGTVVAGAGAGPAPYYAEGRVYWAGPYKGAPVSLAIVTPVAAGPYDLGTVVVRTALHVNAETARVTAVSDPIPHILQGIPVDIRSVLVKIDRPRFMLNPTNCDPLQVEGTAGSVLGRTASLSSRFQVGECSRLGFGPKLSLRLRGATKRGGHPRLSASLSLPKGESANIARASVAFPHSEFLEQAHIRTVCTRVQFAASACPQGSIYGYAKATSPLVDYTVEGPVYLRSSSHPLPDLVMALRGPASQPIEIDAVGRVDSVRGGIRVTLDTVPDVPVSSFEINMQGGKKGLLVNSRDICKHVNRATVQFDAQNGKTADSRPALKAQCRRGHHHGKKMH